MEDLELKNIWKEYDRKIEEARILNLQSWVLNLKAFEFLQMSKAKSKLNDLSVLKKWMILAGVIWVAFLLFLISQSLSFSNIFFLISLSAIVVFNIIAIAVYIHHVLLIRKIDTSENIVDTQENIAKLQASTLQIVRILFLQSPFYTTFFWSQQMITENWSAFFLISLPVTLAFTFLSIWLYKNIQIKNANKKWFKILFRSREWTSVIKASQFVDEIEKFKNEFL